VSVIE